MLAWLRRKKWVLINAVLVGVLMSLLGIRIADERAVVDRSVKIGIGNEKVITIGHVAYAAGSVDYAYDGTDDNVQFQAALNALPATGGRIVDVSAVQKNFSATVTRAIPNVTIIGTGRGSYFTNDGVTDLFTAGGNNWVFQDLRIDAGDIGMGATTGWEWRNVTINTTYYAYMTDDATTASSWDIPTGRSAMYIVAASDAPAIWKAQADIVVDGTLDTTDIETYIGSGNASICLSPGTFVGDQLTLRSGLELYGQGRNVTILRQANGSNVQFIIDGGLQLSDVYLHDMTIDYNHANQVMGLLEGMQIGHQSTRVVLERMSAINCKGYAFQFATDGDPSFPNTFCVMRDLYVAPLASHNDLIVGVTNDSLYENIVINGMTKNAGLVLFEGNRNRVVYNHVAIGVPESDLDGGLVISSQNSTIVMGNEIVGTSSTPVHITIGIRLRTEHDLASSTTSANNLVQGNTVGLVQIGMVFEETSNDQVIANVVQFTDIGMAWPNWGHPVVDGMTVELNRFQTVNTPISDGLAPTNRVLNRNRGYTTENSGVATIPNGDISVTVNHGLATNATAVLLTGTHSEVKDCIVANITATQFTITASSNVTLDRDIYWRAWVGAGN